MSKRPKTELQNVTTRESRLLSQPDPILAYIASFLDGPTHIVLLPRICQRLLDISRLVSSWTPHLDVYLGAHNPTYHDKKRMIEKGTLYIQGVQRLQSLKPVLVRSKSLTLDIRSASQGLENRLVEDVSILKGAMNRLRHLSYTGPWTPQAASWIVSCQELQTLHVDESPFCHEPFVEERHMFLPNVVAKLPNLTDMHCRLSHPTSLERLAQSSLACAITKRVKVDSMYGIGWTNEHFASLACLSSLTGFSFGSLEKNITDEAFQHLKKLDKLETLQCECLGHQCTGEGLAQLAHLPRLTSLTLSRNIQPTPLRHLESLSHLTTLKFADGNVSTDKVTCLVARCPNLLGRLTCLDLGYSYFLTANDLKVFLSRLTALRRISLGVLSDVLTRGGLEPLFSLPHLESVELFGVWDVGIRKMIQSRFDEHCRGNVQRKLALLI